MSHPEISSANNNISPPIKSPLKLASLAAGIAIVFLGKELDSHPVMVFLTLLFFVGPYIAIAFASKDGKPFGVGFAAGYGLSMVVALAIYLILRSFGAPISSAPVIAYGAGLLLNFVLLTVAVVTWIRLRKRIAHGEVFAKFVVGLGYPFLAFVILGVIANAVSR